MVDEQDITDALAGAVKGDETSFATLWRALNPPLLRYLRVVAGDGYEDVASETWLQASRDMAKFRGDGKAFQVWLFRIARNRAIDDARSQGRQPLTDPLEFAPEQQSGDDTADEALAAMATRRALAIIAELPKDQAEAVLLRAVAGLSAEHAGKVTGKRAGAIRVAAMRGLRALGKRIERDRGDGGFPPGAAVTAAPTPVEALPDRRAVPRSTAARNAQVTRLARASATGGVTE